MRRIRGANLVRVFGYIFLVALMTCSCSGEEEPAAGPAVEPESEEEPAPDASAETEAEMEFALTSSAFKHGQPIPVEHTGDGEDISPPLAWENAPEQTTEFALIVDDPDAPGAEPWVHWVLYRIPFDRTSLPEAVPMQARLEGELVGMLQGRNDFGETGYGGPAPPRGHGVHHYRFTLYALDAPLNLPPGAAKSELLAAMEGAVVGEARLTGTCER
mgnify:CR=1 FL=1